MRARSVVVIGSGIGGSACAALVAKGGARPLLVEKNPRVGGSCSWYEKRGFQVDYGTHMFTRGDRGPLGVTLRRIGAADRVPFLRVSDLGGGARPRSAPGACRPRRGGCRSSAPTRFASCAFPVRELPRVVRMFWDLVHMRPDEIEAWDRRTIQEFVERYTDHPRLYGLFGFLLGLYFILPPWEVSAGEAIWCFQAMVQATTGCRIRAAAPRRSRAPSATRCERYGGELRTRAPVVGARAQRRRAVAGASPSRTARSSTRTPWWRRPGLRDVVERLVGVHHFPSDYVQRVQALKKSYVAVQAKIALPRKRERAGCIVGGWARDPSVDPWNITLADYRADVRRPRRRARAQGRARLLPDPDELRRRAGAAWSAASDRVRGGAVHRRAAPRGHAHATRAATSAFIDGLLGAMKALVPGAVEEALFVDTMSTEALASWIGKAGGPAVSTGQTPSQVGRDRPTVRTPLPGLYVCGDGAGGRGIGTELACASAMECVDALAADGMLRS